MRVSERLAGMELKDWRGRPRRLEAFWQERPAVLVFLRHFG